MSKKSNRTVKTESDLQKLIEDTRKLRQTPTPVYNPTVFVLINGTEVANHRESGFPKFNDIKRLVEKCITKYKPILIVVDSSLRYLIPETELDDYENALKQGLLVKTNVLVPIEEVGSYEETVLKLLKLALEKNAKIISNEDLAQSYESIKQKPLKKFENKKFLVHYKLTNDEIAIFEP